MPLPRKPFQKINITPNSKWAQKFWDTLTPLKDQVVEHRYFKDIQSGKLPMDLCHKGLIDFYPLVENFPKFMALNLAKTKMGDTPGNQEARYWLIQNIKVEQNHDDWWVGWAEGFGVTREQLHTAKPSPQMDAINHYLWYVNTYGSLAEGMAATNLAIEWSTGEWTMSIVEGVKSYSNLGYENVKINDRVMSWLTAHASYDDKHPYEAMEIIKLLCDASSQEQEKALQVAKRSLEYYILALDDCYTPAKSLATVG